MSTSAGFGAAAVFKASGISQLLFDCLSSTMSLSLDSFVAGPSDGKTHPLGRYGGMRVFDSGSAPHGLYDPGRCLLVTVEYPFDSATRAAHEAVDRYGHLQDQVSHRFLLAL
jgi:hypothetical protein